MNYWGGILHGVGVFVQTVGVPAAIAFFVLFKLNESLKELTVAMNGVAKVVDIMNTKMDDFFERRKNP